MNTIALGLTAAALIASQAGAQAPPKRAHHAMGYDESVRRVVLTGGSTPTDGGNRGLLFNDVWSWDGRQWAALGESGTKMSGVQLAWDSRRGRLTSFGGWTGPSHGVLRTLEGNAWRDAGQHPSIVAAEPGFIYDRRRDRFLTFGGSAGQGRANGETWERDSTTWQRVDGTSPPARQAFAMVHDERRGVTLAFGGMGVAPRGTPPPQLGDTWEFDGRAWKQLDVTGPTPRASPGATYDAKRGLVIIFGGLGSNGFLGDTWSWDGTTWRKLADAGPEPRAMGHLAYDRARDRVVLFGGRKGWPDGDLNDTWEWDGMTWHRAGQ